MLNGSYALRSATSSNPRQLEMYLYSQQDGYWQLVDMSFPAKSSSSTFQLDQSFNFTLFVDKIEDDNYARATGYVALDSASFSYRTFTMKTSYMSNKLAISMKTSYGNINFNGSSKLEVYRCDLS